MTLNDLAIGDQFTHALNRAKGVYKVVSSPMFNIRHGSPTRICKNMLTGENESKSCRLVVTMFTPKLKTL